MWPSIIRISARSKKFIYIECWIPLPIFNCSDPFFYSFFCLYILPWVLNKSRFIWVTCIFLLIFWLTKGYQEIQAYFKASNVRGILISRCVCVCVCGCVCVCLTIFEFRGLTKILQFAIFNFQHFGNFGKCIEPKCKRKYIFIFFIHHWLAKVLKTLGKLLSRS